MRVLRDLWATSPGRSAVVAALITLEAVGQVTAATLAGRVLVDRSTVAFTVLSLALAVSVLGELTVGLLVARLTADWSADVRRRLCRVALGQELPALENTPVGELLDRIDSDVYEVAGMVRGQGIRIAQLLALSVLSVLTALVVWWPAGVGMLVLTGVLVALLSGPTRRISPARLLEEEAWSDLAAVMEESVHGQDDVRTALGQPYVLQLYADRGARVLSRGRRVWQLSANVTVVAAVITHLGLAAVVLAGLWALTTGHEDGAGLTAIWLLTISFGITVHHLARMIPELQNALGAWARIQLLAASPQEPLGGRAPSDADLQLRDLTFGYTPGRPVLRSVSLSFARGRSYAVIGRTGSGKSTLAKLLSRAVEPPRGTAFLGGVDLRDLDLEALRRWVAVVPQRTEILAGTLAENIALFDPDLLAAAERAIGELGLAGWVAELPDGLQTRLGDGGHTLSAGQEQLVAFARILVRDPHVVVLDEATARMDPVTEAAVQRATERLLHGRIGIVIAHRLSSVRHCDEVVVLADGEVVEAGPLAESERFAELLTRSEVAMVGATRQAASAPLPPAPRAPEAVPSPEVIDLTAGTAGTAGTASGDGSPQAAPGPGQQRPMSVRATLREVARLSVNDPRYGVGAAGLFVVMMLLALDGSVLSWLWADLVDGDGSTTWPAVGLVLGLLLSAPLPYWPSRWFPEWWVRQMLRINLRLVHGQTGARRRSGHTPAEVVAQGGDVERVVVMADNLIDQAVCVFLMIGMTVVSGSPVPALFFGGAMLASGLTATGFGPILARSAQRTVAARAAFATALVSSLSAARTLKLAGATGPVLAHLGRLDRRRSDLQRREIATQVWARSTPSVVGGLLPIAVWALYLAGSLDSGATLVAVGTLASVRWFAWTTASLISQLPSARVWTRRTVTMTGTEVYSAAVPGVDLATGAAPAPPVPPRHPLRQLELAGFGAVHPDGTRAVTGVDLAVGRGELVLVVGPVGSGKSTLLRALAGIVHHTGGLTWNGDPVTEPELFLRPQQVGYVAQLPRVLSGTVADNISLGHDVDAGAAVATAQLDHDLAMAGGGLGLLIGHKGTRLSGGQLQRLALARALAPNTELLVADDVSSALDVTTELALWQALRERGLTVIGSTSKRAALVLADQVLVLVDGRAVAVGRWSELEARWGHLAG